MVITLSQPLTVDTVEVYMPCVFTKLPSGNWYVLLAQMSALTEEVEGELKVSCVLMILSHPLALGITET
jgi:hypothetical protein